MTLKALLNRSLDRPGTLLVNNRYLRMAPRAVVCIVAICLPAVNEINTVTFLGSLVGLLQTLAWWEVMAAMESGAKWFEPKES
jgi:hypothetical protein